MNKSIVQKVDKPWGHELRWAINEKYLGKILHINRGCRLSVQYHNVKDETVYVLSGILIVDVGRGPDGKAERSIILSEGESLRIKPKTIHRFCAPTDGHVRIIEVSTPEIDDVVRLQDDYGRS
jgi:mannose-6-phosphate isomerase